MKFGRKYVGVGPGPPAHPPPPLPSNTVWLGQMADLETCSLPRNQVPEWAGSYINYKGLKKLVKAASRAAQNGEPVDLAGVFPPRPAASARPSPSVMMH